MGTSKRRRKNYLAASVWVLSVFICVYPWFHPAAAFAQEAYDQEVAVNLAEGRVIVLAAKDAIILGTMDAHSEPDSKPPAISILSGERMGVMLGAVEWVRPDSSEKPVRLDREFHALAAAALNTAGQPRDPEGSASDIESIGIAVLERLRQVAGLLHHKISVAEDEPVLRIVLAGNQRDYGPEAWTIDYFIHQDALGNGFFRTRVQRPSYYQLYPPEKGKPHTLLEVRYPPENRAKDAPELLDLLQQNDPRLATIRASNVNVTKSVNFVTDGQSQKSAAANDVDFLKAALTAVAPQGAQLSIGFVDFERGFQWAVQPAEAPPPPEAEKAATPAEKTPEEPERPSLRRKSP
jgi:hypothetical protein